MRITDSALVAAATLSNRYITDRFLPDKAIDLIDEAASRLRMQVDSKPEELDELDRRDHPAQDRARGAEEGDRPASKDRLARLEKELADLEEQSAELTARWQAEKEKLGQRAEAQGAARRRPASSSTRRSARANSSRAGELAYGRIPELEKKLTRCRGQRADGSAWSRRR